MGITGAKRAGKDTVADILVAEHGYVKVAFADALKDVLNSMDPIVGAYDSDDSCGDPECCGGPYASISEVRLSAARADFPDEDDLKASEYGDEYRRLLQNLGTQGIRKYDDTFWIRQLRLKLWDLEDTDVPGVVITDVRFENEAALVREFEHGSLWHIVRPGTESTDTHITEQLHGNLGENVELVNDGSIVELASKIGVLV